MAEFIFVRHGKSLANAEGWIADDTPPLVAEGEVQAKQTAQDVKALGITKILHSPLLRAAQTAKIIAEELGLASDQVQPLAELRERGLGELEGKPKNHDSEWYFTADDELGVEPRQDLIARSAAGLEKIKQLVEQGETVLVVGHAVAGFYLLQVAKGHTTPEDFDPISELSNAGFVRVSI